MRLQYLEDRLNALIKLLTAKGSLWVATGRFTPGELPVGANDTTLVADSAQTTGVKWQALSSWTAFTEAAQDATGAMAADTTTIDLTYTDATPALTADIITDSVSNTLLANMAQATVKGRATGVGTGDPTDLTATQLVAIIATADGAGSGLDADTLDALNSTAFFILAGQAGGQTGYGDTAANGDLILHGTSHATKTTSYILLQPNGGNVGIGNSAPAYLLHVGAGADTLVRTETTLAVQVAGTATLAVRDTSTDAEVFLIATGAGFVGTATNHALNVYTNNAHAATFLANGNFGVGTADPATKVDIDAGSNTSGLRLRGTAETTEIADLYMGAGGHLILDLTAGGAANQFFDFRPEDDQFGLIIRESDGTGTGTYGNLYVVDAADDYMAIVVDSQQDTDALLITASNRVGIGILPQGKFHGHDGTGGWIFSTQTGVAGTAVNVIANGTGDTTARLFAMYSVKSSGGLVGQGTVTSGVSVSNDLFNDATNIFRIIGNADGSIDVQRTGGSQTWTVALWAIWL